MAYRMASNGFPLIYGRFANKNIFSIWWLNEGKKVAGKPLTIPPGAWIFPNFNHLFCFQKKFPLRRLLSISTLLCPVWRTQLTSLTAASCWSKTINPSNWNLPPPSSTLISSLIIQRRHAAGIHQFTILRTSNGIDFEWLWIKPPAINYWWSLAAAIEADTVSLIVSVW